MRKERNRFPRKFQSVEDLPRPVAELVFQHLPPGVIRLIVTIPPGAYPIRRKMWGIELPFGWRQTPERTLIFGQDHFLMIDAARDEGFVCECIPLAALVELQHFQVLLYSWLALRWDASGEVRTARAEYNSVGTRLMWKGISAIRETFAQRPLPGPGVDATSLADFPYKFRNYTMSSLLPGEQLAGAVYQPAIRAQERRWSRYISPNRVLALTDRSIVLIEDQHDRIRWGSRSEADHAVMQRFLPLERFVGAEFERAVDSDQCILRFAMRNLLYEVRVPLLSDQSERVRELLASRVSVS